MEVEEGEIIDENDVSKPEPSVPKESNEFDVYQPLERPVVNRSVVQKCADPVSSASSESASDEDSCDETRKRYRRSCATAVDGAAQPAHNSAFAKAAQQLTETRRRRDLSVWSNVVAEDELTSQLGGRTVNDQLVCVERDVESYHLPDEGALNRYHQRHQKKQPPECSGDGKRSFRAAQRGWKKPAPAIVLPDLEATELDAQERVAADIATKLSEDKLDVVANVVRVVGVLKAIKLFEETKNVQLSGGMLVNDWSRRRTSGGVFIQLLKTDPEVTEDQVQEIFREDRRDQERVRRQQRRKKLKAKKRAEESKDDKNQSPSSSSPENKNDIQTEMNTDTSNGIQTEMNTDSKNGIQTEMNTDSKNGIQTEMNTDSKNGIQTEMNTDSKNDVHTENDGPAECSSLQSDGMSGNHDELHIENEIILDC